MTFTEIFKNYLTSLQTATTKLLNELLQNKSQRLNFSTLELMEMPDISQHINDTYYYSLLQRLVYNILLFWKLNLL